MHILIITDSYPPELRSSSGLMAELAEGLSAKGHEVTVATTFPGYNLAEGTEKREIPPEEIRNGVRVLRVEVPSHHKVPNIIRGINQVFFLPPIFMRGVQRLVAGPFDAVIVHSPPLPLALAAAKLAKVQYLVTGNTRHFTASRVREFLSIPIVTPAEFLAAFRAFWERPSAS